jgi:hypothetical protein
VHLIVAHHHVAQLNPAIGEATDAAMLTASGSGLKAESGAVPPPPTASPESSLEVAGTFPHTRGRREPANPIPAASKMSPRLRSKTDDCRGRQETSERQLTATASNP